MRIISKYSITVSSGIVLVVDPAFLFDHSDQPPYVKIPDGMPFFDGVGADGEFSVYQSSDCFVVDTAPRQFKAGSRADFHKLDGTVSVESGKIVLVEAPDRDFAAQHFRYSVMIDLPPGDYLAWCEENEGSMSAQRTIIGLGAEPHLFLAGNDANTVAEFEQLAARALRMKGRERQQRLDEIRAGLLELHFSGSKDKRLGMLAQSLKLDLPARRGKLSVKRKRGGAS